MMPDKQRSVVVLPAPFGPTNPNTSPGRTVKDKSLTAGNLSYSLVNPSTSIMASGTEGVGRTGRTHLAGKLPSGRQAVKLNRTIPPGRQGPFKNRRKRRSRRGNEAEVSFAPKSASLRRRLPFLNAPRQGAFKNGAGPRPAFCE